MTRKWTRIELGLEDYQGEQSKAPILKLISQNKGPGPDHIIDMILHGDDEARAIMFDEIEQIFNDGKTPDESSKEGKLMLLSKTGDANPLNAKVRPIVI